MTFMKYSAPLHSCMWLKSMHYVHSITADRTGKFVFTYIWPVDMCRYSVMRYIMIMNMHDIVIMGTSKNTDNIEGILRILFLSAGHNVQMLYAACALGCKQARMRSAWRSAWETLWMKAHIHSLTADGTETAKMIVQKTRKQSSCATFYFWNV